MKNRVEIFRGGESRKAHVTFVISKEMKDEGGKKEEMKDCSSEGGGQIHNNDEKWKMDANEG